MGTDIKAAYGFFKCQQDWYTMSMVIGLIDFFEKVNQEHQVGKLQFNKLKNYNQYQ